MSSLKDEPIEVFGYSADDLMEVDPVVLRTLIHERTHHTIEVLIYRIMAGKMGVPANFGEAVEFLLAGATAIQIGTAIALKNPNIFKTMNHGINTYLQKKKFRSINEIVGLSHRN